MPVPRDDSTVRDYLRILRRRKSVVILAVVLVPAIALAFSLRQPATYRASADVFLKYQNLAAILSGFTDPSAYYVDESKVTQTQIELARLPATAKRVIDGSGVTGVSPGTLLASSGVAPHPNAYILEFWVENGDRGVAARLANEYARQFTIYRRQLDTGSLQTALRDATRRLAQLRSQVGERAQEQATTLANRADQLRTFMALQTSNATVVREAAGAAKVAPRPQRAGVLGLVLGAALGIGLAFLWEALDTRVRRTEEIGERLGLPLLARIPEPPRVLRRRDQLVMLADPHGNQAETFRMLRTNLEFVNLDRDARSIMVTSALEQEGKSTTIANLAVALARAGRRVALVDLDLRKPYLARFFGLEGRPGVTDVALGHAELQDALAEIELPGSRRAAGDNGGEFDGILEVLPAGPLPPSVGEFVATHALIEILERLRERADFVLLDSPPILSVGDAMVLAGRIDAVVLVTRLRIVRKHTLSELRRVLDVCPAEKLGFVLSGADMEDGYGYGAYYGRYYGRTEQEIIR